MCKLVKQKKKTKQKGVVARIVEKIVLGSDLLPYTFIAFDKMAKPSGGGNSFCYSAICMVTDIMLL